jgi:hypothetical protein
VNIVFVDVCKRKKRCVILIVSLLNDFVAESTLLAKPALPAAVVVETAQSQPEIFLGLWRLDYWKRLHLYLLLHLLHLILLLFLLHEWLLRDVRQKSERHCWSTRHCFGNVGCCCRNQRCERGHRGRRVQQHHRNKRLVVVRLERSFVRIVRRSIAIVVTAKHNILNKKQLNKQRFFSYMRARRVSSLFFCSTFSFDSWPHFGGSSSAPYTTLSSGGLYLVKKQTQSLITTKQNKQTNKTMIFAVPSFGLLLLPMLLRFSVF